MSEIWTANRWFHFQPLFSRPLTSTKTATLSDITFGLNYVTPKNVNTTNLLSVCISMKYRRPKYNKKICEVLFDISVKPFHFQKSSLRSVGSRQGCCGVFCGYSALYSNGGVCPFFPVNNNFCLLPIWKCDFLPLIYIPSLGMHNQQKIDNQYAFSRGFWYLSRC